MLQAAAREQGTTLPVFVTTAFAAVLGRLSGQDEICLLMPVTNRSEEVYQNLVGFFVNTVVLRCELSGDMTSSMLLRRMHAVWNDALVHAQVPLQMVLAELSKRSGSAQRPLFQVMIDFGHGAEQSLDLPGLSITSQERAARAPKFDLLLFIKESPAGVESHARR